MSAHPVKSILRQQQQRPSPLMDQRIRANTKTTTTATSTTNPTTSDMMPSLARLRSLQPSGLPSFAQQQQQQQQRGGQPSPLKSNLSSAPVPSRHGGRYRFVVPTVCAALFFLVVSTYLGSEAPPSTVVDNGGSEGTHDNSDNDNNNNNNRGAVSSLLSSSSSAMTQQNTTVTSPTTAPVPSSSSAPTAIVATHNLPSLFETVNVTDTEIKVVESVQHLLHGFATNETEEEAWNTTGLNVTDTDIKVAADLNEDASKSDESEEALEAEAEDLPEVEYTLDHNNGERENDDVINENENSEELDDNPMEDDEEPELAVPLDHAPIDPEMQDTNYEEQESNEALDNAPHKSEEEEDTTGYFMQVAPTASPTSLIATMPPAMAAGILPEMEADLNYVYGGAQGRGVNEDDTFMALNGDDLFNVPEELGNAKVEVVPFDGRTNNFAELNEDDDDDDSIWKEEDDRDVELAGNTDRDTELPQESDRDTELPPDRNTELPPDRNTELPPDRNTELPPDRNTELPPDRGVELPPGGEEEETASVDTNSTDTNVTDAGNSTNATDPIIVVITNEVVEQQLVYVYDEQSALAAQAAAQNNDGVTFFNSNPSNNNNNNQANNNNNNNQANNNNNQGNINNNNNNQANSNNNNQGNTSNNNNGQANNNNNFNNQANNNNQGNFNNNNGYHPNDGMAGTQIGVANSNNGGTIHIVDHNDLGTGRPVEGHNVVPQGVGPPCGVDGKLTGVFIKAGIIQTCNGAHYTDKGERVHYYRIDGENVAFSTSDKIEDVDPRIAKLMREKKELDAEQPDAEQPDAMFDTYGMFQPDLARMAEEPAVVAAFDEAPAHACPGVMEDFEQEDFHAPSGEDEALYEIYFSNPHKLCGTIVEIGAKDGLHHSKSHFFEHVLHWKSILIEANPVKFASMANSRPGAYRVHGGFCEGDGMSYYGDGNFRGEGGRGEVLSEVYSEIEPSGPITTVPCVQLQPILRANGIVNDVIDILYVAVAGDALAVIRDMDWTVRVNVWVLELDGVHPDRDDVVRDVLSKNDYVKAEWEITRWCNPYMMGNCMPNEVWLKKGYNPIPTTKDDVGRRLTATNRRRRLSALSNSSSSSSDEKIPMLRH